MREEKPWEKIKKNNKKIKKYFFELEGFEIKS